MGRTLEEIINGEKPDIGKRARYKAALLLSEIELSKERKGVKNPVKNRPQGGEPTE